MQEISTVIMRKQAQMIRVQRDIEKLKDLIRASEFKEHIRRERNATGSSLAGALMCGLLLGAMILLTLVTR